MVPKRGKPLTTVSFCRSIALLPVLSTVIEKLLYELIIPSITRKNGYQVTNLDFENIILQLTKAIESNNIETSLEEKKVCSRRFSRL